MSDALGDRMKLYEGMEAGRRLMPRLPACARIDGRSFSKFTQGMSRPYDERMSRVMQETTRTLVSETNASVGYTQSDEISLAWYAEEESQIFFDGRLQKMTSQLAALATLHFNRLIRESMPEYAERLPTFDARVWNCPTLEEAANAFVWREMDATKNSISMAARSVYSHKALHGKNCSQMQEMLFKQGINWNDYPDYFKRGTYFQRRKTTRRFTAAEVTSLPPRHQARANPDLLVERTDVVALEMPPILTVTNRVETFFFGADPNGLPQSKVS
jgi:tRNA(His) guanylyltransferase